MEYVPHSSQPAYTLVERMDDSTLQDLLRDVIERRGSAHAGHRQYFEAMVRQHVRANGFRDPFKTPSAQLATALVSGCRRDPGFASVVLDTWYDCHPQLELEMQRFLTSRGIRTYGRDSGQETLVGLWDYPSANQLVLAFREAHPDRKPDDIDLMFCYLTRRDVLGDDVDPAGLDVLSVPSSEAEIGVESFFARAWQGWLEYARALPAKASFWDEAYQSIDELRQLVDAKLAERVQWRELEEALRVVPVDTLQYLGVESLSLWSLDACPFEDGPAVLAQVRALNDKLLTFQTLLVPAATFAAQRERDAARDSLGQEIIRLCEQIDKVLRIVGGDELSPLAHPETDSSGPEPPIASTDFLIEDESSSRVESGDVVDGLVTTVLDRIVDDARPEAKVSAVEPMQPETGVEVAGSPPFVEPEEDDAARVMPSELDPPAPEVPVAVGEIEPGVARAVAEVRTQDTPPGDTPSDTKEETFWSLIESGDITGAYWMARSLEAGGAGAPAPSWLLEALEGTRWAKAGGHPFISKLGEIASLHQPNQQDTAQCLLGLAAALRAAVVAPYAGLQVWLVEPRGVPLVHELVRALEGFAASGIALRSEDLRGMASQEERETSIIELVEQANSWLKTAPEERFLYSGARAVWTRLVQPESDLRSLVEKVARDQRASIHHIEDLLTAWDTTDKVTAAIDRIRRQIPSKQINDKPIVGQGLDQLVRDIERTRSLVAQWCAEVRQQQEVAQRGDWWSQQVLELWSALNNNIPMVVAELPLALSTQPFAVRASGACLVRAARALAETFEIAVPKAPPVDAPYADLVAPRERDRLSSLLRRRLLLVPEIELDDEGVPLPTSLPSVADALSAAHMSGRNLEQAVRQWIQQQDYRFLPEIEPVLPESTETDDLLRQRREEERGSRARLEERLSEVSEAIEQAFVDGILSEEVRAHFSGEIAAVNAGEIKNFQRVYQRLRDLEADIDAGRLERIERLRATWDDLAQQLAHSHFSAEEQSSRRERIEAQLATRDARLLEEFFSTLRRELDGDSPSDIWASGPEHRLVLEEFQRKQEDLQKFLRSERLDGALQSARNRENIGGVNFARLTDPRRRSVIDGLQAWSILKRFRTGHSQQAEHVARVLDYLGFTLKGEGAVTSLRADAQAAAAVFRARMSASTLARPIPEFGSRAHDQYTVVCLWDRPGAEAIEARLRDLGLSAEHVIVLYLGILTPSQRIHLMRQARDRKLAIAVLDETLLLFLAGERDARLPAFLRVALPFAAVNPYAPTGDVPLEMFFGRRDMANDLQQAGGTSLVFGGRQLGKSALLRQVQRQFHDPGAGRYASIIDMKRVFDPLAGRDTEYLWQELRNEFLQFSLFDPGSRAQKPDTIRRQILEVLQLDPGRRILLLFDEADEFLDTDAEDNFRQVIRLRDLMNQSDRRFRVVFAGLHGVQRFQEIPNQPLAHFGVPLCVGPLDSRAAQQLVREPLDALGYRFDEPGTVLRILSYTNYHPGLIQLFCRELLEHLRRQPTGEPPFVVRRDDIDAVYRNSTVRDGIRQRFEWTLNLDLRYQAIALMMIEDQLRAGNGYAQFYRADEMLERGLSWWPAGFENLTLDALRGLLDEMCGLGVLVRDFNGRYGLRSPNVVRLLGSDADIEYKLVSLADKQLPPPYDYDNQHAALDESFTCFSPLTISQERALGATRNGIGLVFASDALGLGQLHDVFDRLLPSEIGVATQIPSNMTEPEALIEWLRAYRDAPRTQKGLIAWQQVPSIAGDEIERLVQGAESYCGRLKAEDAWMRVIFLFDPTAQHNWLKLPEARRLAVEEAADALIVVRRWNAPGLRARLERSELLGDDAVCAYVLQATGGWPVLLDLALADQRRDDDPRPGAARLAEDLAESGGEFPAAFWQQLGVAVDPIAERLLRYLEGLVASDDEAVPLEFITPGELGDPRLTDDACQRALVALRRLGCVDLVDGGVVIEPTVRRLTTSAP